MGRLEPLRCDLGCLQQRSCLRMRGHRGRCPKNHACNSCLPRSPGCAAPRRRSAARYSNIPCPGLPLRGSRRSRGGGSSPQRAERRLLASAARRQRGTRGTQRERRCIRRQVPTSDLGKVRPALLKASCPRDRMNCSMSADDAWTKGHRIRSRRVGGRGGLR